MSAALVGCDFSSSPGKRKAIVLALGSLQANHVQLQALLRLASLRAYADWLEQPRAWIGAFDFPFGLPRNLVQTLGWPLQWHACMAHYAAMSRREIRDCFAGFCAARPAGNKFAHRATDGPAGSSPSMKWVNPPVAYMLHAGVPPLIAAGVHIPGLSDGVESDRNGNGQARRVALEAYPGMLARELIGRASYKSDETVRQTPARSAARRQIIAALQCGENSLGLSLDMQADTHRQIIDDASGDCLDAALCLMQAAWGSLRGWPLFGLPVAMDPLEGWIVTAVRQPSE
ncbi:MAG: DUF429 domain-containing protein [Burkholderiaceae bacterium]